MSVVKNVTECSLSVVRSLDEQLISEMNRISPNCLVSFGDLNVQMTGPCVWPLLQPPAKEALRRAINDRGKTLSVTMAYRTLAQQLILYRHHQANRCGIVVAARPCMSNHQSGLCVDINDHAGWKPYLEKYGWRWLGPTDPTHFDFMGQGTLDLRTPAVIAFQRLWNRHNPDRPLMVDGEFGSLTEARLGESPLEGFQTSPPKKEEVNHRILRLNEPHPPFMQGEDVRELQEALNEADIDINVEIDGIFGPSTEQAVKQFQTKKGLGVDGVVGPATRRELRLKSDLKPLLA